jgi:porin
VARYRTKIAIGTFAAAATLALIAGPAGAQTQPKPAAETTPLTDFGNKLLANGIFLRGDYIGEFAANPSGGIKQSQRYAGQADAGVDFDLNKIAGIGGAAIHVTISDRHGRNLAADDIGNSVSVQEIFGGGQTYRLTELSWDQALLDDRLEFLVGRIDAPNDFAASPFYCNFQTNSTCGNPSIFGQDNNLNFYPVGIWGGRVTVKPTPRVYFQTGLYEQDPSQGNRNHHGFDWSTDTATGMVIPFELGYQTTFASDPMPRHYKAGAFIDTADYNDPFLDVRGGSAALSGLPFKTHSGRATVYGLFDQMIWRPDPKAENGLYMFGGISAGTSNDVLADYFLQFGLLDRGPVQGRDDDTIGFVVTDLKFSSRTQNFIADSRRRVGGTGRPDPNEIMMELNYGAQITSWLRLVPNLQYIINPDQVNNPTRKTNIPDAFVIGAKLAVNLPDLLGLPTAKYNH